MDKYGILYRFKRIKGNISMITDDFKHDHETPFTKKVWAWTKGFSFLSDQAIWLEPEKCTPIFIGQRLSEIISH